ncbi:hypothetical protein JOF48_001482 [Arthrobacter stackebrandtii]|uniref:Uncharacterized protein n=1 Tax=Arthrobacter stackebrandtii TaxID=272161 RepID=A0ABS4YV56_9MICC|nr:hypothetical protein [Arthrobacter stackebrandtii]MBP2412683.1 hypothetical protein [Arthrobacter stackebrandtii]
MPALRTVSIRTCSDQRLIQAVAMDTQRPQQQVLDPDMIGMKLPRCALRRL